MVREERLKPSHITLSAYSPVHENVIDVVSAEVSPLVLRECDGRERHRAI